MLIKNKTKRLLLDAFLSSVLSCILIGILYFAVVSISFFNPLVKALEDFNFTDVYYAENFNPSDKINPNIIIINIEDKGRMDIAFALETTLANHPKVVGLDVIFKEAKDPSTDSILASLMKDKRVINAIDIQGQQLVGNHPTIGSNGKDGFININFDNSSRVIRTFDGTYKTENIELRSFANQISKEFLGQKWDEFDYANALKKIELLDILVEIRPFLTLTIDELMLLEDRSVIKDKIVLFGYVGIPTDNKFDVEDKFHTPLNEFTSGKSVPDMFGVIIHANIIDMLISNTLLVEFSNFWVFTICFLLMFLSTIYFLIINKKYKISFRTRKQIYLFVFSVIVMGLTLLLFKYGVVIAVVPILASVFLAGGYFKYYKHLVRFIKTKVKWKTYIK